MALWLKIYWTVFAWIMLIIFVFSFRIVAITGEHNLQKEYENALDKHAMLNDALQIYANANEALYQGNPELERELIRKAVRNYGRYYTDKSSFIAVTNRDEKKLYSSMAAVDENSMALQPAYSGERSYVMRSVGSRSVIFVSGWVQLGNGKYRLDYERDITAVKEDTKKLAAQISIWLAGGMTVVAGGLFIILKRALRPLDQLGQNAKAIARGQYEQRIKVERDDEVGRLAADFNDMAEAVQVKTGMLQRMIDERETFIASFAHELKTPLTSIMGYASLLELYNLNEKDQKQAVGFIRSESKRLDELAVKLMDLFRISDGKTVARRTVQVTEITGQLEKTSSYVLSRKGQRLDVNIEVAEVTVDPALWLILLGNLVENASKASPEASVIELRANREGAYVVFRVIDRGYGIPEERLEDVFQPFFMLDRSRDRKKNGHGLGLSLCRAIAEAHGGNISLISREGLGTTVIVKFPG